jgi:hypothetical protein
LFTQQQDLRSFKGSDSNLALTGDLDKPLALFIGESNLTF